MKKTSSKSKNRKDEIHVRSKYVDHSLQFLNWVNGLGFEKSFLGRFAQKLDARFHLRRVSLLFLFCLLVSFLLFIDFNVPYHAEEGLTTRVDLKSPITFTIVDEVATEKKRQEAEAGVLPIFDYDPDVYEKLDTKVYKTFKKFRDLIRGIAWSKNESAYDKQIQDFFKYKGEFESDVGVEVSSKVFEWLVRTGFKKSIEESLSASISSWSNKRVVKKGGAGAGTNHESIIVREIVGKEVGEEYAVQKDQLQYVGDRRSYLSGEIAEVRDIGAKDRANVRRLLGALLVPNVTFNLKETLERRHKAREAVLPVQISIKKNQVIVSKGSVIQPIHMTILNEIKNLKSDRRTDFMALVTATLFVTLILVFFSYSRRFTTNKVRVGKKEFGVMALVTVTMLLLTKLFLFLMDASFMERWGEVVPDHFFLYLAPVAAGPMLVGLVITSGEVVWLFTTFAGVLLATMVDLNFNFLLVSIVGGIAAARGVFACEKRNDIYWAGIRTGIVNAIVIACLIILNKGSHESNTLHQLMWIVPGAFFSGLLSSMLAMTLVPIIESMFNFVTDVKLLELSNLSHPLMQAMVIKSPGTYHHCLSVGTMVFAAAQEIQANPLLAKVMAYYHDIGKMDHANYFIENQRPGMNPHDHLSPYMSKTVLIAHVKDGAEMAIKHKLGKPILDGILQHHGTSLISYFYNKAISEQNEHMDHVLESEFRYPGPKPQFREAALVMLADSIEAAARSLDEPTPIRLQNLVKNIIQGKFIDGQLDECNLTLKDLSVIEKSFKHSILSIYHQRMDYPHMKDGKMLEIGEKKGRKGQPA